MDISRFASKHGKLDIEEDGTIVLYKNYKKIQRLFYDETKVLRECYRLGFTILNKKIHLKVAPLKFILEVRLRLLE